jgi:hypothetical protein
LTFFITQRAVVNVAHAGRRPVERDDLGSPSDDAVDAVNERWAGAGWYGSVTS